MNFLGTVAAVLFNANISFANVVGTDAQNFNPTPDGLDYVTVFSSETLEPGIFNLGLFLNYAENTFPAYEGTGQAPSQGLLDKNDSLTSADFNLAVGLTPRLQVGASFPYVINQTVDDSQNLGSFDDSGFTEYRGSLKYNFKRRNFAFMDNKSAGNPWGIATVLSFNVNRIQNNPYVGDDPGPTYNLELVFDREFISWSWSGNVGYRFRNAGDPIVGTGIEPFPNQWIGSLGVSKLFSGLDTKVIFEIYGSYPAEEITNATDRSNSSFEVLAGLKHDYNKNLSLHAGGGTELSHGTSTPDWRVYVGANWALGPLFAKEKSYTHAKTQKGSRLTSTNLNFASDSDQLTPGSKVAMDEIVEHLRGMRTKIRAVTVLGHTDSVGPEVYNQDLSERRARTVRKIIVKEVPLPADRVFARGYGESEPIASNGNYQGRLRNRRVELDIEE